jgi:hypothetical protein
VALRRLVGREPERVGLTVVRAGADDDHDARAAACADDRVLRLGRAVLQHRRMLPGPATARHLDILTVKAILATPSSRFWYPRA